MPVGCLATRVCPVLVRVHSRFYVVEQEMVNLNTPQVILSFKCECKGDSDYI